MDKNKTMSLEKSFSKTTQKPKGDHPILKATTRVVPATLLVIFLMYCLLQDCNPEKAQETPRTVVIETDKTHKDDEKDVIMKFKTEKDGSIFEIKKENTKENVKEEAKEEAKEVVSPIKEEESIKTNREQVPSVNPAKDEFFDTVTKKQYGDTIETTSSKTLYEEEILSFDFDVGEKQKIGANDKQVGVGISFNH